MPQRYRCSPHLLFIVIMLITAINVSAEPISALLTRATGLLGTPYRNGGMSQGGFDCSGFVTYLYRSTLPGLPRISRQMVHTGEQVPQGQWRPGDLLFYATGVNPNRINHVAIWFGEGLIIHSISGGPETGVVITPANSHYWQHRYISARRVLPLETSTSDTVSMASPMESEPSHTSLENISVENSPWNDFDGFLQGDYNAWKEADNEAFENYKESGSF